MKSRTFVRVLLLTAVLIAAFGIGERYSGFTSAQSRQKWEYQVVKADRIVDNRAGTTEIKGLAARGATAAFSAASMWADRARFTTAQAVTRN